MTPEFDIITLPISYTDRDKAEIDQIKRQLADLYEEYRSKTTPLVDRLVSIDAHYEIKYAAVPK